MTQHLRGLMTETLRGNFLSFFKNSRLLPQPMLEKKNPAISERKF